MNDFDSEILEEYEIVFEDENRENANGGISVYTDTEFPKDDTIIIPENVDEHSFVYDEFSELDGLLPEYDKEEIEYESNYEIENETDDRITTTDKIIYLEQLRDEQMKLMTRKTNVMNLLAELYEKGTVSDSYLYSKQKISNYLLLLLIYYLSIGKSGFSYNRRNN